MDGIGQTKHYHMIAGLDPGVAVDQFPLPVAYQSCQGHIMAQSHIFYLVLCDLGTGTCFDLGHIRISQGHELRRFSVGLEQNLEYLTRGEELLVDDGADVEVFGCGDILKVFYFGYRLAGTQFLAAQGGEDV